MRDDHVRRASTGIGALTRKDRYREAALARKVDDAYRDGYTAHSPYRRRRHLRAARRHERALLAQRRRPLSALVALAVVLGGLLALLAVTRVSLTAALVVIGLLAVDACVIRFRRRRLRRA